MLVAIIAEFELQIVKFLEEEGMEDTPQTRLEFYIVALENMEEIFEDSLLREMMRPLFVHMIVKNTKLINQK